MASSELKLISWTAIIVMLLGVASVFSLLQPPQAASPTSDQGLSLATLHKLAARSIASIAPASKILQPSVPQSATDLLTLDIKTECRSDQPIQIAATVREIRLSGTSCAGGVKVVTTEIKNISNGFVATVFHQKAQSFTTDYLTLNKGENRILVHEELKSGKFTDREYTISRN